DGVRRIFADAGDGYWRSHQRARRSLDGAFAHAASYLRDHPDFESFNRLAFVTQFVTPAAHALDVLRQESVTIAIRIPRGWRASSMSPYDVDAFDTRAYAPTTAPPQTAELIDLGRRLFTDERLSGTGTRSCASCHTRSNAFQDGVVRAD